MNESIIPPCARPEADPDDWFIEISGAQYGDDPILTEAQAAVAVLAALAAWTKDDDPEKGAFDPAAVLRAAEAAELKRGKIRRRRAKEACFSCPVRLKCADQQMQEEHDYGTWGGHLSEEWRKIRRGRKVRRWPVA